MEAAGPLSLLARVLTYPRKGYLREGARCQTALLQDRPEAARHLERFLSRVSGMSTGEIEELFTATFDLNPACSLEVGWHLFGEDYERGRFLVKMRQALRRLGVAESGELPDHLTHVLEALQRMAPEEACALAGACLPALERMLAGLEGKDNPYVNVLRAVRCVLIDCGGHRLQEVADA